MQGQGWQNELQAQTQYGRSQLGEEVGVSNRPFGATSYQGNANDGFNKPRQLGSVSRPSYERHNVANREGNNHSNDNRPTGHLAFLKSLQRSGATVRVVTIHDEAVIGAVKDCDETTISIRVPCATEENPNAYQNRVFFKQNLVEFAPVVEGVTFS